MRIQHNIMAMNAYRNYTNNVSAMKKNLEKLSSGYKINRAGDDAAGLAISEKMRAQITGLQTAQKNAKDGISLVQTAEGALTEVHDMLNRMVELATQSANGTYDNETDRDQLQKEVDQLRSEINRIADSANFNGIKLLDGSMQSGAIMGAKYNSVASDDILKLIPKEINSKQPTVDAQNTIVETDGAAGVPASFSVKLDNLNAVKDDTFKLILGDTELDQINVTEGMSSEEIAAAVAKKYEGKTITLTDSEGNNADFTVTADGKSLQFKANAIAPFDPPKTVSYTTGTSLDRADPPTVTGKSLSLPVTSYAGDGTKTLALASDAITHLASVADSAAALDEDTIAQVAGIFGVSGAITVKVDDQGSVGLYVGDTKINNDSVSVSGDIDDNGEKYDFTYTPAGGGAAITLGGISVVADGDTDTDTDMIAQADMNGAVFSTGLKVDAATANVAVAVDATTKASLETDLQNLGILGDEVGNAKLAYNEDSSQWELSVNGKTLALTAGAVNATTGVMELTSASGGKITITPDTGDANKDKYQALDYQKAFGAGKAVLSIGVPASVTGTINGATQNIQPGSDGASNQVANTTIDLSEHLSKDGTKITLGDTTYTVALGPDSKFKGADNVIDLTDMTEKTFDAKVAATRLTTVAKENNGIFSVGHDGAGKTTLQQLSSAKESTDMTTREKIASYIGVSTFDTKSASDIKVGRGLTLQIGDTADSFNKLEVSIKDMHVASLGLDNISIADQDSAAAAVDAIKKAINAVSDVRGTLGATQNRLDHTINNLGVMTENIQDAESTIRDVDIAEEMMAYTKNNILIQSAQAMLAQANQVPQGVLQLLG